MAQKIVNNKLALGVAGEFYDASIKRTLVYTTAEKVRIGSPVFIDGGKIKATGTAATCAGIAVCPKEHVNTSPALSTSLEVDAGKSVAVANLGRVIVNVARAATVGQSVYFCTAVGSDTTATVGDIAGGSSAPTGGGTWVAVPNAKFIIFNAAAGEPAVVELH